MTSYQPLSSLGREPKNNLMMVDKSLLLSSCCTTCYLALVINDSQLIAVKSITCCFALNLSHGLSCKSLLDCNYTRRSVSNFINNRKIHSIHSLGNIRFMCIANLKYYPRPPSSSVSFTRLP